MISTITTSHNSNKAPQIIIIPKDQYVAARALEIADKTGGVIITNINEITKNDIVLIYVTSEGISLSMSGNTKEKPVFINFSDKKRQHRLKNSSTRNEAIARAAGLKSGQPLSIIDTTAGLGEDSFILAALGANVTMLERNVLIHILLSDAIQRANMDKKLETIMSRIKLVLYDSIDFLEKLSEKVDVIYMDPMFPEKNTSANSKKEMRLLREIVGSDTDIGKIFCAALEKAGKRVVVKRPLKGFFVNDKKPHFSINGKSCRFDVYITQHMTAGQSV